MGAISAPPVKRPYLYIPDGWDAGWVAAKAAVNTAPATITVFGDSFASGMKASDAFAGGWVPLVRANLLARGLPLSGDFYPTTHSAQFDSNMTGAMPWNRTGATVNDGPSADLLVGPLINAADTLTYTSPYACTGLDIVFYDRLAGSFTYTVDGGAPVTVTTTGNSAVVIVPIRGLASATHTLVVGGQNATWTIITLGVTCYQDTTKGLAFANTASSGNTTWPTLRFAQNWSGRNAAGALGQQGFPMRPHLAILTMGINDCGNGNVGPDQFFHVWRQLIYGLRRGRPNVSVLFVVNSNTDGATQLSDITGFAQGDQWPLYVAKMYQLANALNCGVVNIHAKWGETSMAQGFRLGDGHPNSAGHADMATTIAGVL